MSIAEMKQELEDMKGKKKENFRVKYIRSLLNVVEQFGYNGMSDEDRSNLNQCIGSIFTQIEFDGDMTKELAQELGLEYLLMRSRDYD